MRQRIGKSLVWLVVAMMMLGILAGCGSSSTASTEGAKTPTAQTGAKGENVQYPLTVKDFSGNELTLAQKPERIVSLTLGTDEMLLSLVEHSWIQALSGKIAEDEGISNVATEAKTFRKAENNIETIISLKPDLVFAASWMKKEQIQQLRDAKIPVYLYGTATNLDEQKKVILEIARLVGEPMKGQAVVADMDKTLQRVADKVKGIKPENRLTVLYYDSSGSTKGKGTSFDDMAQRAGLINVTTQAGLSGYPKIAKEKIIELNPDMIVLPSWSYDKKKDPASLAEEFKKDQSLATVKAIKNHRVYMLPDKHVISVSQYMALGVEDLAKAAYPDLFK
ncbi:MAG: ABC transporter substrate-binding protein [Desulfitobacteriaceae bacterium]|nr:ABC transporter substrate-binding protein [Desulfitobacteriaceae bacterium]MDI6879845.1 ABC transporter substrate-binding protein [Desulfitobacteriaceae bacterium]MDI6915295.1 ABC transporter substrate-binding protein [Desulfitobacteriaceae bacterium]